MSDWTDNPFAQSQDDNPFADPSVTSATAAAPAEYNPFDAPAVAKDPVSKGASSFAAAPVQPTPAPQPATTSTTPDWAKDPEPVAPTPRMDSPPKPSNAEAERKREYQQRQQAAQSEYPPGYRPANWPPFPVACPQPFKPCFHHNIKGEIPDWGKTTLKQVYYTWQLTVIVLFWNFICALATLSYSSGGSTGQGAGIAVCFFVCFVPCSYLCWFHPLYNAMRKDSSLRFGWFFFVFGFQFISSCFMAAGIPGTGAAGLILAIQVISSRQVVGIMLFTAGILWIILALLDLYLIKKVLQLYRSTGQSMEKMENEWKKERDQGIYNAATSDMGQAAISGAVRGAASGATSSDGPGW